MDDSKIKLIYIHIPKTAGRSMQANIKATGQLMEGYTNRHEVASKYVNSKDWQRSDVKVLATIRNPFDRMYSLFNFYSKNNPQHKYSLLEQFEPFVLNFKEEYLDTNVWAKLQSTYIEGGPVHLLRFESLDKDWKEFCTEHDLKYHANHIGALEVEKPQKDTLYTPHMITEVTNIFKNDLKLGNYTYEQWVNSPWNK